VEVINMLDSSAWSIKILILAEDFYLWSNNWTKLNSNEFLPPDDVRDFTDLGKFIRYTRQQALAIQRQMTDNKP
jgi:hypothetical protein